MKRLLVLSFLLLVITPWAKGKTDKDDLADVTVIFCGMPERVEPYVMEEFREILCMREKGEIGPNICLAGLLKFGEESCGFAWQKSLANYDYDGTLYIDLGPKSGHEIAPYTGDTIQAAASYLRELHAQRYADKYFRFFNTDSLSHLIRKVAAAHPARHYVLCMFGHGNGQYCLRDDYFPLRRGVTAAELETAVKQSGVSIHTLFLHNCLMGTLDNLAHFQHIARYVSVSADETCGGYLPHYLANLSKAGCDTTKLVELSRETMDFYAKTNDTKDEIDTSLGYYDLSKTPSLLTTVKDIAKWYAQAATKDSLLVKTALTSAVSALRDSLSQTGQEASSTDEERPLILADLLSRTLSLSRTMSVQSDMQQLESLCEKYIAQLKNMAYIRCNHLTGDPDIVPYHRASPSLAVINFSKASQRSVEKTLWDNIIKYILFTANMRCKRCVFCCKRIFI